MRGRQVIAARMEEQVEQPYPVDLSAIPPECRDTLHMMILTRYEALNAEFISDACWRVTSGRTNICKPKVEDVKDCIKAYKKLPNFGELAKAVKKSKTYKELQVRLKRIKVMICGDWYV